MGNSRDLPGEDRGKSHDEENQKKENNIRDQLAATLFRIQRRRNLPPMVGEIGWHCLFSPRDSLEFIKLAYDKNVDPFDRVLISYEESMTSSFRDRPRFAEVMFSNDNNSRFLGQAIERAIDNGKLVEFLSAKRMVKIPDSEQWVSLTPLECIVSLANAAYVSQVKNKDLWRILIDAYKVLGKEGYGLFYRHFDEHCQSREYEKQEADGVLECVRGIVALLDQPTTDKDNIPLEGLIRELKILYIQYLFCGGCWGEYNAIVIHGFIKIYNEVVEAQRWPSEKMELFLNATNWLILDSFGCEQPSASVISRKLASAEESLKSYAILRNVILALSKTAFSEETADFPIGLSKREIASMSRCDHRVSM
ncbi:MAG TPA: hypothetical protein VNC84_01950 [Gammaproteobacteria bacterium]|nr:hypothetical protein [Gammaproteobacteria bacterium]